MKRFPAPTPRTREQPSTTTVRLTESLFTAFTSPWLYLAVRLALAFLFIYAGGNKLVDPKAFARTISRFDVVPEFFLPVIAIGLPLVETAAGIGLALNIRGSLSAITGMLLFFVGVLGYGVMNDLNIDCGCFGAAEIAGQRGLMEAFYRDLILTVFAGYLYIWRRTRPGIVD